AAFALGSAIFVRCVGAAFAGTGIDRSFFTAVSSMGFSGIATAGVAGPSGSTTSGRRDAVSVGAGTLKSFLRGVGGSSGFSGTATVGIAVALGNTTFVFWGVTCDGVGTARSFFATVSSGFGGSGTGKGPASAI